MMMHRADRPEEADRADREEQPRDVHRRANQPPRGGERIVVELEPRPLARRRRHLSRGEPADRGDHQHEDRRALDRDIARHDRAEQDGEIGPRLDEAGAAQHVLRFEMLRQDGVFDRAEEGRMDAEEQHRAEHQRDAERRQAGAGDHQPGGAQEHDADLGGLDDADDPRLVVAVRQLPGERGEQEEGQNRDAGRQRVEIRLHVRIVEDRIGREQHHRRLEQIVVEGAEELGGEEGQEAALLQQPQGIQHAINGLRSWRYCDRHSRLGRARQRGRWAGPGVRPRGVPQARPAG